jgi:hypothetical protein
VADSVVFERTCELLVEHTSLERIEVRGTVRIALKGAGLDVGSVDASQMRVVLDKLMPSELENRGVGDASATCAQVARAIEDLRLEGGEDRAAAAAETLGRFGGGRG